MSPKLNISMNEIHEVKICLNFIWPPCMFSKINKIFSTKFGIEINNRLGYKSRKYGIMQIVLSGKPHGNIH